MELPLGQLPEGGDILAPVGSHTGPQIPLLMITLAGAVLRLGQQLNCLATAKTTNLPLLDIRMPLIDLPKLAEESENIEE